MTVTVTHPTPADGTFSPAGSAAWDEDHDVQGLGTAAEASVGDFATAAQGALADSALQFVSTDGSTILGDGTPANPLIAVTSPGPAATGTYLVSGATVAWVSGYTYSVGAASYYIDGTLYSSVVQPVTAGAADPTYDRIDVIALNTAGVAVILPGTASPAPAQPDVDPTLYLQVSFVYVVAASAGAPVTSTTIYKENIEWVTTASAGTINVNSPNNPHAGTKCIEGTAVHNTQYFQSVAPSPFDLSLQNTLIFYVYCKAAWASKKAIQVTWFNSTSIRGQPLTIGNGQYGFNSQITGYQQIVVPVADFIVPAGTLVDRVRFTFTGTGAAIGFYIDDITMQAGFSGSTGNRGNVVYRGTWTSAAAYEINDLVTYSGLWYIAIATSTNATPSTSPLFWGASVVGTPPPTVSAVAYAATLSLNWSGVNEIRIGALTGNLDITAMSNPVDGGRYVLRIAQDGTGGRTFTISAANVLYPDDIPSIAYSTTASKGTLIGFIYNSVNSKFELAAVVAGY